TKPTVVTKPAPAPEDDQTELARALVKQARVAYQAGRLDDARVLATRAKGLKAELNYWEDSPEKLLADISRAKVAPPAPAPKPAVAGAPGRAPPPPKPVEATPAKPVEAPSPKPVVSSPPKPAVTTAPKAVVTAPKPTAPAVATGPKLPRTKAEAEV